MSQHKNTRLHQQNENESEQAQVSLDTLACRPCWTLFSSYRKIEAHNKVATHLEKKHRFENPPPPPSKHEIITLPTAEENKEMLESIPEKYRIVVENSSYSITPSAYDDLIRDRWLNDMVNINFYFIEYLFS